jgi:hypothetical protein
MKRIALVSFTLVAMLAVNVSGAMAAHTFLATTLGTVKGKNLNTQVFKSTAVNFECKSVKSTGQLVAMSAKTQIVHTTYSRCSTAGMAVAVTEAEFQLNAEGSVSLLNNVVVTINTGGCSLKLAAASNSSLKTVKYAATGKHLRVATELIGISYQSSGPEGTESLCGKGSVKASNGSYLGEVEYELENGGTLAWS